VLVIVLSVLLLIGCAFLLTLTVRAQRRDFAVLRALGAKRGQLRLVVHWQATLVALAILLVGVPLGVALGRLIVQQLTGRLGIVPGVEMPMLLLLGVVAAAVAAANLLAVPPARRAARPASVLLNQDG
jgi:ABC-type antimicrobial peptide transport system permease subunit